MDADAKNLPETTDPIQVVHPCCCGLDVHKREVQAGLRRSTPRGQVPHEQRTFSTMTDDLLALLDWLRATGCTHVAMESSGVYWKPIYNLLDGHRVLETNLQPARRARGGAGR